MSEDRAKLSSAERNALPDSAFAYIDEKGERHFPIHNKAHVVAALRLGPRSPMWSKAKGKVMAAAKKYGVGTDTDTDAGRSLESLWPEVRFIQSPPELRSAGEGEPTHITGHAAVFEKVSRRLGNFHEKVMRTAFDQSSKEGWPGVICRFNHRDDMLLGTTDADTLRCAIDETGLAYDVIPPNHRGDVTELVERRDVRYSSFAFRVPKPGEDDSWEESEYGLPMRSLHRVETVDVAPVTDPAYRDTTAAARNISGAIESLASWVDGDPAEIRSILEAGQAKRLFHRSDRPSAPALDKRSAQEREETRVLDDPAVSLRSGKAAAEPVPEGDTMVPEDERAIRSEDEIRAAMKPKSTDQLCMRFHHGEPCVRPTGHAADGPHAEEGGHAGLCWGRHDGLPCNQHEGHEGQHTPMTVASRDGAAAGGEPETRSEEPVTDPVPEPPKNLSAAEALVKLAERRKSLTALDGE